MLRTVVVVETRDGDRDAEGSAYRIVRATPDQVDEHTLREADLIVVDYEMADVDVVASVKALCGAARGAAVPVIVMLASKLTGNALDTAVRQYMPPSIAATTSLREYRRGQWKTFSLQDIAEGMDVPRSTLANVIGVSERNLSRWIHEKTRPQGRRERSLQRLQYLYYLLTRALKQQAIPKYLRAPNPALAGRTPLMALEGGDFSAVESDLLQLIEGVYV